MFSGYIPTLITPFHQQRLDTRQLHELIEWHLSQGCTALCVGGVIGEGYSLSIEEQETLFNLVAQSTQRRVPVIAHIISNSSRKAIWLTQAAEAAGVNAVIHSLTAYHANPMQQLIHHCRLIQQNTALPIYVQHDLEAFSETDIQMLADIPKIKGIIDTGQRILLKNPLLSELNVDLTVSCGNDIYMISHLINGTQAYFSSLANVMPTAIDQLIKAGQQHDFTKANSLYQALIPLYQALYEAGLPAGLKYVLSTLQLCQEETQPPLATLNERQGKLLQKAYETAKRTCDRSTDR